MARGDPGTRRSFQELKTENSLDEKYLLHHYSTRAERLWDTNTVGLYLSLGRSAPLPHTSYQD